MEMEKKASAIGWVDGDVALSLVAGLPTSPALKLTVRGGTVKGRRPARTDPPVVRGVEGRPRGGPRTVKEQAPKAGEQGSCVS